MCIIFWHILRNFWPINNTIFEFYNPPPSSSSDRLRSNWEGTVRSKNYTAFLQWQDFQCQGICDLSFLGYCTISVISQESIIELRNTLSKTDSQDTSSGILKFSDLLNLTWIWLILHRKSKVIYDLGHES